MSNELITTNNNDDFLKIMDYVQMYDDPYLTNGFGIVKQID